MRTSVWLLRAGQNELNRRRAFVGQHDVALTDYGRIQVTVAGQYVARQRLNAVVSGPQPAMCASAQIVAHQHQLEYTQDAEWADQDVGALAGLTWREASQRYPQEMRERQRNPLGARVLGATESLAEVAERVAGAWQRILVEYAGQRVVVVTQALPIQLLLAMVLGRPLERYWEWRIDQASWSAIEVYGGTAIVRCVNATVPVHADDVAG